MLKGITQRVIGLVVELPFWITEILVEFNFSCGGGQFGALQRKELAGGAGIVTVVLAEESQRGVGIDVPGKAGGDVVTLVVNVLDGGVAIAHHTADTVQKTPFVIDRTGAVEADLLALVATDLQLHFVAGQCIRAPTDHVEHPAWRCLAVQRGRRATQQGYALKVPGLHLRHGVSALG
ncbi:hypothetical protein D3C76_767800 [compost metagenome]